MNLTAENISVTIGGKEILRGVSYKFTSGKRTAIIGANGAGKSTLLKVLCLLNEKFSGVAPASLQAKCVAVRRPINSRLADFQSR